MHIGLNFIGQKAVLSARTLLTPHPRFLNARHYFLFPVSPVRRVHCSFASMRSQYKYFPVQNFSSIKSPVVAHECAVYGAKDVKELSRMPWPQTHLGLPVRFVAPTRRSYARPWSGELKQTPVCFALPLPHLTARHTEDPGVKVPLSLRDKSVKLNPDLYKL